MSFITPEGLKFISNFSASFAKENNLKTDNDKTISSAFIYEKLRVAVEYQEEHLILKNTIGRIIRRKYALSPSINANQLFSDLISELAWANYINPEVLKEQDTKSITSIIDRYLILLKYAKTGRFARHELNRTIIDWLACEIDEFLRPDKSEKIIVDYTYNILIKSLDLSDVRIDQTENEIQLKGAIYGFILKPDYAQIQFWFLKHIYPDWQSWSDEEVKKMALSFDPYYNKIDHALNHPYRKNYIQFTKRLIPPFMLLYSVLKNEKIKISDLEAKPSSLHDSIMAEYNIKVAQARDKVWRGTFRALIFILLTKISLAFILEIPFDRYISGTVDLVSLLINISLPPLLMLFAGTFVKSPSRRNYKTISDSTINLLTRNQIDNKKYTLIKGRSNAFLAFNIIYLILSLAILSAVIWLLIYLRFNIVSIILFFFFVSVVSFFSFRIRNIALELAMKRGRDDALTSILELFFMPFVRIGKFFSDRFAYFNPMILALDFLIEAPLKIVIKIMNSWLRFINAKKEELEL